MSTSHGKTSRATCPSGEIQPEAPATRAFSPDVRPLAHVQWYARPRRDAHPVRAASPSSRSATRATGQQACRGSATLSCFQRQCASADTARSVPMCRAKHAHNQAAGRSSTRQARYAAQRAKAPRAPHQAVPNIRLPPLRHARMCVCECARARARSIGLLGAHVSCPGDPFVSLGRGPGGGLCSAPEVASSRKRSTSAAPRAVRRANSAFRNCRNHDRRPPLALLASGAGEGGTCERGGQATHNGQLRDS